MPYKYFFKSLFIFKLKYMYIQIAVAIVYKYMYTLVYPVLIVCTVYEVYKVL